MPTRRRTNPTTRWRRAPLRRCLQRPRSGADSRPRLGPSRRGDKESAYFFLLACRPRRRRESRQGQVEDGVTDVIEMIKRETDRTLALIGCRSVSELDRSYVSTRPSRAIAR
ncbi:alpha-hydroxy-acid oxidizing protein [Burkholderia latens]|nr:alpha-hydroxy-acid oxidizing protein [Burkholderia latens]